MTSSEIRQKAREALTGKWGKAALITLCYFLVEYLIGFIIGIFEDSAFSLVLSIANIIITVPLSYGILYEFIKLKRGENVKVFDFFNLGFSNFKRSWKVVFSTIIKMIVPIALIIVAFIIFSIGLGVSIFEYNNTSTISSLSVISVIALIVMFVAEIWAIVKGLYYVLSNYIAIDNPEMSSKEAVLESERLMQNNRAKYFLLNLSFIGWAILSVFTLYIGLLWLTPYMQVAQIVFYELLAGKNNKNETEVIAEITPEENNAE